IRDICFINVDFTSSSFSDAHLFNVKFEECDLTSADFTRSGNTECDFSGSVLNGTDFSYAVLDYCNFNEADMAGSVFQESDLTNSDLSTSYNLNACRFDDGTIWPDEDMLPDNFDGMYSSDLSSLQDEEDESVSDY
ncbi:MAG: pentapeptide repeat-containing protein, partial [Candidatus Gastranaerophilales bacterium]|nr:pentapeptide repeat-containing protein [Candidatus Gastranaerophilales bacterium]